LALRAFDQVMKAVRRDGVRVLVPDLKLGPSAPRWRAARARERPDGHGGAGGLPVSLNPVH
jgi:hypothetical protein